MVRSALFFVSAFAVACVEPQSGDYLFEAVGDPSGDCPEGTFDDGEDDEEEEETQGIRVSDDGDSFKYAGVECDLDGVNFDCVLSETENDLNEMMDTDAVITTVFAMNGSWTASDYIVGSFTYDGTCEGGECDAAEEAGWLICSASIGFSAQKED